MRSDETPEVDRSYLIGVGLVLLSIVLLCGVGFVFQFGVCTRPHADEVNAR